MYIDNLKIPEGQYFCSYCGQVKTKENYERTLNDEFHMCNTCYNRKQNIKNM